MTQSVEDIFNYLVISDGDCVPATMGTGGQPTAEQFAALQAAGYTVVVNLAVSDSPDALPDEEAIVTSLGMTYVSIPVVWESPTLEDLTRFFATLARYKDEQIFVHCIANMRVSVFVFLYRVLCQAVPVHKAREDLQKIWEPKPVWRNFIARAFQDEALKFVDEPAWVAPLLAYANEALVNYPPEYPPSVQRQEALMLLDGPLHLATANRFRSVYDFLVERLTHTIEEIEHAFVTRGVRIWRLYDHGFVVRTPSITIGCDVTRGWTLVDGYGLDYVLPPAWTERLVRQLDVLTVSHRHDDHADPVVRDLALQRHIPVVVEAGIYGDLAHPYLWRAERLDPEFAQAHPPVGAAYRFLAARGKTLDVVAYPGHQGADLLNNVYLFCTSEGFTVLHMGDQSGNQDWAWLNSVGDHVDVDVLIVNCWTTDMARLVQGVRPNVVITGHENEMSHAPNHRESYWRSFELFRDRDGSPAAYTLCWGEGLSLDS